MVFCFDSSGYRLYFQFAPSHASLFPSRFLFPLRPAGRAQTLIPSPPPPLSLSFSFSQAQPTQLPPQS